MNLSRSSPRLAGAVLVGALGLTVQGCLLLGHDLSRIEAVSNYCGFDVIEAYRCPGFKSSYQVEGYCKSPYGVHFIEGTLSWKADGGSVGETYSVRPILNQYQVGPGEIWFSATCDLDPFTDAAATCSDADFHTTISPLPIAFLDAAKEAKPVARLLFSEADLAEHPVEENCAPSQEPAALPPVEAFPPPIAEEVCTPERIPALMVSSPPANEQYKVGEIASFQLDFQQLDRDPRPELVEIEWEKLEGRRFTPLPGLVTVAAARNFPLTIVLSATRTNTGPGIFQVRVRPYDPECARKWSVWQEFEVLEGGLVVSSSGR